MADFKHLVRIANTDLDGKQAIGFALNRVKGVGIPLANAICKVAGISPFHKSGELTDDQIKKIDDIVRAPHKVGLPAWMLNRRHDPETGENKHLVTNELIFSRENDIKQLRRIKSYKGLRHAVGLPVRGQRTKSHFRANKGKVMGVRTSGKKSGKT